LQSQKLIAEDDAHDSSEYAPMVGQWKGPPILDLRVLKVWELSPDLRYPGRLVVLSEGRIGDNTGWLVSDGPRSRWYPAADLPTEQSPSLVLSIHVGRELLGFREEPDRRSFLRVPGQTRSPCQIIDAYERLLKEARNNPGRAKELLSHGSPLGPAFHDYVNSLVIERGMPRPAAVAAAYESLREDAQSADASLRSGLFDSFAPVGARLDDYVNALIDLGRKSEIPLLIEQFRPYWDHNRGYGMLGSAAYRSGFDSLAEPLLIKLKDGLKDWHRCEEMGFLADIWFRRSRPDDAHQLLIDALTGVLDQSRIATGSDRRLFEEWFENHLRTYRRLFPDLGDGELKKRGIPTTTLSPPLSPTPRFGSND
jgi:hypothetical protein